MQRGQTFSVPFFIWLQPSNCAIPPIYLEDEGCQVLPESFISHLRELRFLYVFSVFLRMDPQEDPRIHAGSSAMV